VRLAAACATANPGFTPPILESKYGKERVQKRLVIPIKKNYTKPKRKEEKKVKKNAPLMYPVHFALTYLFVRISGDVVGMQKLLYLRAKSEIPNNKTRSTPRTYRYLYIRIYTCRSIPRGVGAFGLRLGGRTHCLLPPKRKPNTHTHPLYGINIPPTLFPAE
jgi:hypothetical protein